MENKKENVSDIEDQFSKSRILSDGSSKNTKEENRKEEIFKRNNNGIKLLELKTY